MPSRRRKEGLAALSRGSACLRAGGCTATGSAAVAYRAADGPSAAGLAGITIPDSVSIRQISDDYGYSWVVVERQPDDATAEHDAGTSAAHSDDDTVQALVGVSEALADPAAGRVAPLCALMSFRGPAGRLFALVFRFDSGTFYPFLPDADADADAADGARQRDNLAELRLRDLLDWTLPMERDQRRWGALWDAPGLG